MKKIWKNYKQNIILLMSLIVGTVVGLIFKEKCSILNPFGDLFMNMMFIIIIPLIFFTITTSIAKIKKPSRLKKLLFSIVLIFLITSLVSVFIGLISSYSVKLVDTNDTVKITNSINYNTEFEKEDLNILDRTVKAISTNDFVNILSKDHLIALIVFSIIVGIAFIKIGKDSEPALKVFESLNKITLKIVDIIFLYAPIGLGCYFASLIGNMGSSIAIGYLKTFIIYIVTSLFVFIIIYSLYAFIAGKKEGLIKYWKNILPATITSISTCSSAASIPINIKCAKKIGVSNDIAEATIPLGTSFHKDGSIIGSVFKIMFLAYLFKTDVTSINGILKVVSTALIANLLVTAVPIGGGTISEMMIITLMGFPIATLPLLTIIATIIDAPATMLNVTGDTASSMLVARIIDGKNWLNKKRKI